MNLFQFSQDEILTFFMVLVRFGTLMAVLPIVGDKFVPGPAKLLLALSVSWVLFPSLVSSRQINPAEAQLWGATAPRLMVTAGFEALYALILGYTAKLVFDGISFGGNLIGNFMGFGMASTYDPHQETQTQVVAEFHMAVAMLIFLAVDGHHLMLQAALSSYQILGIGGLVGMFQGNTYAAFAGKFIELTQFVIQFGIQIAGPVALSLFAVNVVFAVMAKAMPQLNVLVLSFSVSALVGLFIMFVNFGEFGGAAAQMTSQMGDWMTDVTHVLAGR